MTSKKSKASKTDSVQKFNSHGALEDVAGHAVDPAIKEITIDGRTYRLSFEHELPPLTDQELADLESDIERNGFQTPIILSEDGQVIDGNNRVRIALKHGITELPTKVIPGLTEVEKRRRAIELNLRRRQLTADQRKDLAERLVRSDPSRSNRAIAEVAKVDHKTIAKVRDRLESTGEIPQLDKYLGKDGKMRKPTRTVGSRKPGEALPQNANEPSEIDVDQTSMGSGEIEIDTPTWDDIELAFNSLAEAQAGLDEQFFRDEDEREVETLMDLARQAQEAAAKIVLLVSRLTI